MTDYSRDGFVVSIYPNSRGVAFVVFEDWRFAVDWGVRGAGPSHRAELYLRAVNALLERYSPAILILQDMTLNGTRRASRIRELNAAITDVARERAVPVRLYSRAQVRNAFAPRGAVTKEAIATVIAKHVPVFGQRIPPPRKPWMSEHARMGLFDAAALALTFIWQSMEPW